MERRFPWIEAQTVAEQLADFLLPFCNRIAVAGSLRRRKPDVGDIEILYIPRKEKVLDPTDLFLTKEVNLATARIWLMEQSGILERRLNSKGLQTFGALNKLMRHVSSGIPVDLFSTTEDNWFNALVCRTGPKELNQRIAAEAHRIGWTWHPYGSGFTALDNGQESRVECEQDVFDFVGIPYRDPAERE